MSYDKLLRDTAILSLASLRHSTPQEQKAQCIENAVKQLMAEFDISENTAYRIVCQEAGELLSDYLPSYIDIDNSTAYCLCIRHNSKPFYISLDALYRLFADASISPEFVTNKK